VVEETVQVDIHLDIQVDREVAGVLVADNTD
jgi:hypothetical protein